MSEFEKELLNKVGPHDRTHNGNELFLGGVLAEHFKDWQPPKPLVVVPQIVADAIESIPPYYSAYGAIKLIDMKITEFPLENEDWKYVHDWIFVDDNANKFAKALIDGYTVEKEKLYLLKHIEISSRDTTINCYLTHTFTAPFIGHTNFSKGYDMSDVKECHFTQSEIDDMETGSYEQIAVTFEEA